MLAKSPKATLYTGVLQPLRYLHDRSDCYRLEQQVAGRELHPLKIHAFARHTATRALHFATVHERGSRGPIDHVEVIHARPIWTEQAGTWRVYLLPALTRDRLWQASTTITLLRASRFAAVGTTNSTERPFSAHKSKDVPVQVDQVDSLTTVVPGQFACVAGMFAIDVEAGLRSHYCAA